MEINGVAHTFITASNFEASVAFYRQLLPFLGIRWSPETPTPSTASSRGGQFRHTPSGS